MIAMPWPPPTHIVSRPNWPSRDCRPLSSVVGDPGAGRAERVAERDRAAVDVELVEVDAEVVGAGQHLRGEGLVDLVPGRCRRCVMPARRERLAGGLDRAEAHDLGGEAGDAGRRRPGRAGVRPSSAALVSLMTTTRGGAVVERAAVAGGDRALLAEHRVQALRRPRG